MASPTPIITTTPPPVEIMCKSPCKPQCKSRAKKCVQLVQIIYPRAKLHLFTDFSLLSHPLSHNPPTPVLALTFPLFHSPYYYNYYIYK